MSDERSEDRDDTAPHAPPTAEGEAPTDRADETSNDDGTVRQPPGERGGPKGPEPTRFGDWEKNGRCFDF